MKLGGVKISGVSIIAVTIAFIATAVVSVLVALYFIRHHVLVKSAPTPITATDTNSLSRAEVEYLLNQYARASLPPDATDVYGAETAMFTLVTNLRFTCSTDDFRRMQIVSPLLHPSAENNSSVMMSKNRYQWWQPEMLTNVKAGTSSLSSDKEAISCSLMSGHIADSSNVTVYIQMVHEQFSK